MGTVHGPEKVFVSPVDSNTVGANVGVILGGEDFSPGPDVNISGSNAIKILYLKLNTMNIL